MEIHFTLASPPMTRWWTRASLPPGRRWTLQKVSQKTTNKPHTSSLIFSFLKCLFSLLSPAAAPCGGRFSTNLGEITSPNWPKDYQAQTVCTWHISVPSSESLHVVFTHFELKAKVLGKCVDYVEIFDGEGMSLLGEFMSLYVSCRTPLTEKKHNFLPVL